MTRAPAGTRGDALIPCRMVAPRTRLAQPPRHESKLMIFMNRYAGLCRYHARVTTPALYPDTPCLRRHALAVGGGHTIAVQEFGRDDGIAAVVLHGGPGSGGSPLLRRVFDPARFRIVCIDQRGAGASQPRGGISNNRSEDLLDDMRQVRKRLGIERWLVSGGSWGAALAVAHAAAEPGVVAALLLRSAFLARAEDIDGFFQGMVAHHPEAWARFAQAAPADRRDALLPWLAEQFRAGNPAQQARAALAWWQWEQHLAATGAVQAPSEDALTAQIDRYRVQSHYLLHHCWLTAPTLLERCEAVPRVPTLLIHSGDDLVCPAQGALDLHARLPGSRLQWIAGAGHDAAHPSMIAATVAALDSYAAFGNFSLAS